MGDSSSTPHLISKVGKYFNGFVRRETKGASSAHRSADYSQLSDIIADIADSSYQKTHFFNFLAIHNTACSIGLSSMAPAIEQQSSNVTIQTDYNQLNIFSLVLTGLMETMIRPLQKDPIVYVDDIVNREKTARESLFKTTNTLNRILHAKNNETESALLNDIVDLIQYFDKSLNEIKNVFQQLEKNPEPPASTADPTKQPSEEEEGLVSESSSPAPGEKKKKKKKASTSLESLI